MRTIQILFIILITYVVFQAEANSQWVVSGSVTVVDTTVTGLIVTSTGRLTARSITVTGDLTIQSGGQVTHASRDTAGLRLNVSGALDIQSGGLIDVNGKGLKGGSNGSVYVEYGETFNANDSIVAGASYVGGGSYGGWGGSSSPNEPYGFLQAPRHLGSGGGGYGTGGNGGGRVTINAVRCLITGTVRANGIGSGGSGGSGGAIRINADTLTGTGQLEANGGDGFVVSNINGAGGGGRIGIYYNTNSFTGSMVARTGASVLKGSAGTIYLKDNAQNYGDLYLDNGNIIGTLYTPLRTALSTFRSVTLRNRGQLQLPPTTPTPLTIQQLISQSNGKYLIDTSSTVLNINRIQMAGGSMDCYRSLAFPLATDIEVSSGGAINMLGSSTLTLDSFTPTSFQSGTVAIGSACKLVITANTATVGNGAMLVKDGRFGTTDVIANLTIQSGGNVTHASRDTAGLRLNVSGTLDIQSGGLIDVSGKGLKGGSNGSVYVEYGETFGTNDSIIAGASFYGGGSYGGWGGSSTPNEPYGLLEAPRHLGSGGGGYGIGGNGGGRVTINAVRCLVTGTIRANGANSNQGGGAGSGGAIRINADTLTGTGQLEANGGDGFVVSNYTGAGGGGRIGIYYNTNSFTGSIIVRTGASVLKGSAGTIYLKDNAQSYGDLYLDNGNIVSTLYTSLRTSLDTLRSVTLRSRAQLQIPPSTPAPLTLQQLISQSNGRFLLDTSSTVLNINRIQMAGGSMDCYRNLAFPLATNIEVSSGGVLNMLGSSTLTVDSFTPTSFQSGTVAIGPTSTLVITANAATVGNGAILVKDGRFGTTDTIASLVIQSGGNVTHASRDTAGLRLNVSGILDIQSGGQINANGKGLKGGNSGSVYGEYAETFDANDSIVAGASYRGGGSYGGWGGSSSPNGPYGILETPRHLGSGGGGNPGGNGGGRVTINARTCQIEGTIQANGTNSGDGGGSGGAIRINADTVSGTGQVLANGGNGTFWNDAGAGGGGRIAIYYTINTFPVGNTIARSGTPTLFGQGSAGTIYLRDNAQSYGDLYLDNGNIASNLNTPLHTVLTRLRNLTLRNKGTLSIEMEINIENDLRVLTGGRIAR